MISENRFRQTQAVVPVVVLMCLAGCQATRSVVPGTAILRSGNPHFLSDLDEKEREAFFLAEEAAAHSGVCVELLTCSYAGPAAELLVWWEVLEEGKMVPPENALVHLGNSGPVVPTQAVTDLMMRAKAPLTRTFYACTFRPTPIPLPPGRQVLRRLMYSWSPQAGGTSEADFYRFVVTCGGGHISSGDVTFVGLARFTKALAYRGEHGTVDRLDMGETATVWSHMLSAAKKPYSFNDLCLAPPSVEFRLRVHLRPAGATTGWPPETEPAG